MDGPRAAAAGSLVIDWNFTDAKTTVRLALSNGALIQTENPRAQAPADLTLTLTKAQLLGLLAGHGLDGIEHTGDPAVLTALMACWTPRPGVSHVRRIRRSPRRATTP